MRRKPDNFWMVFLVIGIGSVIVLAGAAIAIHKIMSSPGISGTLSIPGAAE